MSIEVTYKLLDVLEHGHNLWTYLVCPVCRERWLIKISWLEGKLRSKGGGEIMCPGGHRYKVSGSLAIDKRIYEEGGL